MTHVPASRHSAWLVSRHPGIPRDPPRDSCPGIPAFRVTRVPASRHSAWPPAWLMSRHPGIPRDSCPGIPAFRVTPRVTPVPAFRMPPPVPAFRVPPPQHSAWLLSRHPGIPHDLRMTPVPASRHSVSHHLSIPCDSWPGIPAYDWSVSEPHLDTGWSLVVTWINLVGHFSQQFLSTLQDLVTTFELSLVNRPLICLSKTWKLLLFDRSPSFLCAFSKETRVQKCSKTVPGGSLWLIPKRLPKAGGWAVWSSGQRNKLFTFLFRLAPHCLWRCEGSAYMGNFQKPFRTKQHQTRLYYFQPCSTASEPNNIVLNRNDPCNFSKKLDSVQTCT